MCHWHGVRLVRGRSAVGWLNGLYAAMPGAPNGVHGPTAAVAIGPTMPQILKGRLPVANLPLGPAASNPLAIDRPEVAGAFDRLYSGNDAIGRAYRDGRAARAELIAGLPPAPMPADGGAPPPNTFPALAARPARLVAHHPHIPLALFRLRRCGTPVP